MKDIQQLIKKNSQEGRYEDIFPKTFIDAVEDRESGNNLTEILSGFNMYFLSYNGSRELTRLQVPLSLRKTGLWITYVLYDKTVVTEWYAGEAIDDDSWKNLSNWRVGSNMLVGDISISSDGYWVVNGVITTTKAQGEQGITPMLRVGSNNHLQVSYTNGSSWVDVSTNPVYTQFRVLNNKLQQSTDLGNTYTYISEELAYKFQESGNKLQMSKDLGNTWEDVSDYIASWFRINNNKLEISRDNQNSWEVFSDYIAAWFKFTSVADEGGIDNIGKIQISRDNGATWSDLSGEFTNSLHIKGYVATVGALPSSAVQGDIYGVGPTYDPSDTGQTNPIYQLYVKDSTGWVNNGKFTSIAAGVVQTTGTSTTEVMSQNAVTTELDSLRSDLNEYFNMSQSNDEVIGGIAEAEGEQIDITWTDGYYLPKVAYGKIPLVGEASISQSIELTLGKKYFIKTSLYELYDVAVIYYNSAEISAGNYVGKGGYTLDNRSQDIKHQFLLTPPSEATHMVVETRDKTLFQLIEVSTLKTVSNQIEEVSNQIEEVSSQIPGAPINILYKENKGSIYIKTTDSAVQIIPTEAVSYIIPIYAEIGDVVRLRSYFTNPAYMRLALTNYEPQDIVKGTIIPKKTVGVEPHGLHELTADIAYKYAIVSSRDVDLARAQDTIDNSVLTINNIPPDEYINNVNKIRESDLTQELQNKINEPIIDLPDWVSPNKPNYTASEVGAVAASQGSYNAGKKLVVGLDGTVGVGEIELGANANIEYVRNEKQNILYLSDSIADIENSVVPENCVRTNNEFVFTNLTSGQKIIVPTTCLQGRKYLVRLIVSGPQEGLVYTVLGNKYKIDMYNGTVNCFSGFIADGNNSNLEIQFNGNKAAYTISEVKIQELVTPEISTDSFVYQFGNVTAGSFSATDICSYWNAVPSMQSTMSKAECVTRNVALGHGALSNLITGTRTVAIGSYAGSALKYSERNIIVGSDALWQSKEATDNVVIGKVALGRMKYIGGVLTMGISNYNVAVGSAAMAGSGMSDNGLELYTPEYNVAIGYQAGYLTKSGSVCIGHAAGYGRGIGEVAIGKNSGSRTYDLPTNCICIGTDSGYNIGSSSSDMKQIINSIVIGYNAKANKSNQIVIGNSSITEVIIANKKIIFNEGGAITWENL